MFKVTPHISEKSVSLAKQGYFTIVVPMEMSKASVSSILKKTFKLKPLALQVSIKKTTKQKKVKKTVADRGFKKMIVKLAEKQVMPGYETFLTEIKEEEKKQKKAVK